MSIRENLERVRDDLRRAAVRSGRGEDAVRLMAVSKTRGVEEIRLAVDAGVTLFGENRVKEAAEKFGEIPDGDLVLIGHLQSNKIRYLSNRFRGVHSVDSISLARGLSDRRAGGEIPLELFLQVNTSGEPTKSGFHDIEKLGDAVGEIRSLPGLKIRGLMTMAPFVDDEKVVRECFARCREWSEKINTFYPDLEAQQLSMGMTSDYRWAVAEGSTLVRIGTAIFGERS